MKRREWHQFKEDLLTTVRVANDYKEIVEKDMEQIIAENKRVREKIKILEAQLDKLKRKLINFFIQKLLFINFYFQMQRYG